jgi:syntaxin 16
MSSTSGGTSEDVVMAKNVTVSLAAKLQELSTRFRQSQQSYLEKIRRSQTTGNEVFGVPVVSSSVGGSSSNPMEMQYELGFNEQQLKMINTNEAAIEQRSHEINEIAKSIFQLAEVFRDLQTMIIDQGTLLDRIDYNIEDMAKNVKTAHEELVQVFLYCYDQGLFPVGRKVSKESFH